MQHDRASEGGAGQDVAGDAANASVTAIDSIVSRQRRATASSRMELERLADATRRHNQPLQLTSFVGRETMLLELRDLLVTSRSGSPRG